MNHFFSIKDTKVKGLLLRTIGIYRPLIGWVHNDAKMIHDSSMPAL